MAHLIPPQQAHQARSWMLVILLAFFFVPPSWAQTDNCIVADNGSGTITIPPAGCAYYQPQAVFKIIDGLPPGTTLELTATYHAFHCASPAGNGPCLVEDGGSLGGQREVFDAVIALDIRGTGELSDYRHTLSLPVAVETHSAPRTPGDPVQSFDTWIFSLVGSLPAGDPDFAQLALTAGSEFGLISFGHNRLTDRGDGTFHVERFFSVNYELAFQGAPGGVLDGLSGTTTGDSRIEARGLRRDRRCLAQGDGSGSVALPPDGCAYLGPREDMLIVNGVPAGSTIKLEPRLEPFVCASEAGGCGEPGGNLGGERQLFESTLRLYLEGTGALSNFRRVLRVPVSMETHSAPRSPGDPVQAFVTDVFDLQGSLSNDPDFLSLTVTGGSTNSLYSRGHTTLQDLGDGSFQVDSFFALNYRIDFEGAPGGALAGMSGSTQMTVDIAARIGQDDAVEGDNGGATATLPPEGGQYLSPRDSLHLTDGLPPGGLLEIYPRLRGFFCVTPGCAAGGGDLGGERIAFDATLDLTIEGNFAIPGFKRQIALPVTVEIHTGPRQTVELIQRFDTDLFLLEGTLVGDPDFSELTLTAGTDNSLPSPGFATLTDQGDGTFLVDSFFDVAFRIDFVGAPGGELDGLSGTSESTIRMEAYDLMGAPAHSVTLVAVTEPEGPGHVDFTGDLGAFALDDDPDSAQSDRRTFNNLPAGTFQVVESTSPDLVLLDIACNDPDGQTVVDVSTGQIDIDLDLGEAILCTFRYAQASTVLFIDDFESGNLNAWSSAQP